ncbi:hypothetical protein [Streptomyces showdoensis]|uniref:Uncharacterized protein n=1 Tax=Streptomyces showdoensis TaxID=68268 RepID=A0A2P2GKL0_STREW|nr:hypothetical protein [Streptomyces showdoensis]KKZ72051.1 hypothetical protein VO63_19880 [Streptomyces showdoensis]
MSNPPKTWTGTTVAEAIDLLDAARGLLLAKMAAAVPGDGHGQWKTQKTTPVMVTVTLDHSALDALIDARHSTPAAD